MQSLGKTDRVGIVAITQAITQAIFHQRSTEKIRYHERHEYPFFQSEGYQIAKRCLDVC